MTGERDERFLVDVQHRMQEVVADFMQREARREVGALNLHLPLEKVIGPWAILVAPGAELGRSLRLRMFAPSLPRFQVWGRDRRGRGRPAELLEQLVPQLLAEMTVGLSARFRRSGSLGGPALFRGLNLGLRLR